MLNALRTEALRLWTTPGPWDAANRRRYIRGSKAFRHACAKDGREAAQAAVEEVLALAAPGYTSDDPTFGLGRLKDKAEEIRGRHFQSSHVRHAYLMGSFEWQDAVRDYGLEAATAAAREVIPAFGVVR